MFRWGWSRSRSVKVNLKSHQTIPPSYLIHTHNLQVTVIDRPAHYEDLLSYFLPPLPRLHLGEAWREVPLWPRLSFFRRKRRCSCINLPHTTANNLPFKTLTSAKLHWPWPGGTYKTSRRDKSQGSTYRNLSRASIGLQWKTKPVRSFTSTTGCIRNAGTVFQFWIFLLLFSRAIV